jgi:hypothetical protein
MPHHTTSGQSTHMDYPHITTWDDYAAGVAATSLPLPDGHHLTYATLGLIGELGEVFTTTPDEQLNELGDVYFYIVRVATAANINPNTLPTTPRTLTDDTNPTELTTAQLETHMFRTAARISEAAKKTIRDNNGTLSDTHRDRIRHALADIAAVAAAATQRFGSTVTACWTANHHKLADRQQRGALHGDGDHR